MSPYRVIIRLKEEPRAVELEITTPRGTRSIDPVDEALLCCGVRAIKKVVFETSSHSVFVAKLVEGNQAALSAERVGQVLDTIRRNLSAAVSERSRAA